MRTVNEVHIIGRAGKDGVVTTTSGGKKLGKFSLATGGNRKKDSEDRWPTLWHNIVTWGDTLAATVSEIRKGAWVEVTGRLSYSTSEKDGVKRYYTDIVAQTVSLPNEEERSQEPPRRSNAVTDDNPITDEDVPF